MIFINFLRVDHSHYNEQELTVCLEGNDLVIKWCNTKKFSGFKIQRKILVLKT